MDDPDALPALIAEAPLPATRGRPSKYRPEYCQAIVDHMAEGASVTSFAASIDVGRRTIGLWVQDHDDFAEAVDVGKAKAAAWWEKTARSIAEGNGGPGASTVCLRALNNFAGEDWTDRQVHEHVGRVDHVVMTRAQAIEQAQRLGVPAERLRIFDQ